MTPQLKQKSQLINEEEGLEHHIDLHRCFYWFRDNFTARLEKSGLEFLNADLNFHLFALGNKSSLIWKGNDYFVTQIEVAKDCSVCIRISGTAAQILLDSSLGKKEETGELKLKNITELEAKILTAYNEFLFKSLNNVFLHSKEIKEAKSSGNLIYLTFFINSAASNEQEAGKMIFSFPEHILRNPEPVKFPENPLDISNFRKSSTDVDIIIGKTKISLDDIKNLETEDIIILENSKLNSMAVILNDEKIIFNVNPDPKLVININKNMEESQQIMNKIDSSGKNIWDNLQVEISAKFKKIKMSLGDLKQITEGLVLDIAPIAQNEVALFVENKKIADGELVIINDKYGIKIIKVFENAESEAEPEIISQPPEPENRAIVSEEIEKEEEIDDSDFDYSDFEIEEDI